MPKLIPRLILLACAWAAAALAARFELRPSELPRAVLGRAYSAGPIIATGGGLCPRNDVSLRLVGGALPEGVTMSPAGYFFGVPAMPGAYRFLVRASNDCGWSDHEFLLEVNGAPVLAVNPAALEFQLLLGQGLPQPVLVRVASDTAGLPYTLEAGQDSWVHAQPRTGYTPARGSALDSDIVEVYFDTARLTVGTHRSWLRVSAWSAVTAPVIPIQVTILPQAIGNREMPEPAPAPAAPQQLRLAPGAPSATHPVTGPAVEEPPPPVPPKPAAKASPPRSSGPPAVRRRSRAHPPAPKPAAAPKPPPASPSPPAQPKPNTGDHPPPPKPAETKPAVQHH